VVLVVLVGVECSLVDNWVCASETSCEFGRNTGIEQRLLVFRVGEVDVFYFLAEHLADLGGDFWVGQGRSASELIILASVSLGGDNDSCCFCEVLTGSARYLCLTCCREELAHCLTGF